MRFVRYGGYVEAFLDAIMPPRPSERIVRALSAEALAGIAGSPAARGNARDFSFVLPYRDERVTALIWELKYRQNPRAVSFAAAMLAEEIAGLAAEALAPPLLIPVPMHSARRRERGHNQTEILAAAAAALAGGACAYAPHALKRVRLTSPQQGLPRAQRLVNVRDSMEAGDAAPVCGRACIVIDDVATTGATMREARRALRAAGARSIYCLALAG